MANVQVYSAKQQKCCSPFNRGYVGESKIIRYEIPCGFTGAAQHTGLKSKPTDICTDRNIGTWKGQNME